MNSTKISIKSSRARTHTVAVLLTLLFILMTIGSCIKLKGEFALKYPMQDTFRRITSDVELKSSDRVQWIYKLKNVPSQKKRIAYFILKKEIVWTEIYAKVEEVGMENGIVYGVFENLKEGQYRLLLTEAENNREIDSLEFTVYNNNQ